MAIIVEEEKNTTNYVRLIGWIVILAVIGAAVYYLFFAAPELVVIPPPAGFQNIAPISGVTLSPDSVLKSPTYVALNQPPFPLPTSTGPVSVGRADPFLAP